MTNSDIPAPADRRRSERRTSPRVMDLSLPEVRRILITSTLFLVVLVLFVWMVRMVIIAAIIGVVIAAYLRPAYRFIRERVHRPALAAVLTLMMMMLPVIAVIAYSYVEIRQVAEYLAENEAEVAAEIYETVQQMPFVGGQATSQSIRGLVNRVSGYGAELPGEAGEIIGELSVSAAVFLFTSFYIFISGPKAGEYLRGKIAPRYTELVRSLERNVRGVLYGAIYSTLLIQTLKAGVILAMNLAFGVPLAVVLAFASFMIGFFPIVGSWTVYVPVAIWLLVFQGDMGSALLMVAIGFGVNTLFFSLYLRPKIAAEKSQVLNFYWMFVGLVTGVYTFGIAGILLGPILIGLLKAILDTVTSGSSWRLIEPGEDEILT